MNAIVKAMIAAGIIDNVASIEYRVPGSYVFEAEISDELTDPATDAKFIPQMVRLASYRLVGAILRASGNTKPLFDEQVEDIEASYQPEDGLAGVQISPEEELTKAVYFMAVVWRIAMHYARVEGNEWLRSITKMTVSRDANGNMQAVRTTDEIIRPFDDWLTIEATRDESQWALSCQYARQLGHPDFPVIGLDEARLELTNWLDEVPPMADMTRREKIVLSVADRKWNVLVTACVSGVRKDIERAMKDWIIICHSPKAGVQSISMKSQPAYQQLQAERVMSAQYALEAELDLAETLALVATMKAKNKARQLALEARQAAVPTAASVTDSTEPTVTKSGMGPKIPSYQHRQ